MILMDRDRFGLLYLQRELLYFLLGGKSVQLPCATSTAMPMLSPSAREWMVLQLLKPELETHTFSPIPGWKATFTTAGHILGAASVLVEVTGRRILFSGGVAVVPVFAVGRAQALLHTPSKA